MDIDKDEYGGRIGISIETWTEMSIGISLSIPSSAGHHMPFGMVLKFFHIKDMDRDGDEWISIGMGIRTGISMGMDIDSERGSHKWWWWWWWILGSNPQRYAMGIA